MIWVEAWCWLLSDQLVLSRSSSLSASETNHHGEHYRPTAEDLFTAISDEETLFLFKAISSPNFNKGNTNKYYKHNSLPPSRGSVSPETVVAFDISKLSGYKRYHDSLVALTALNLVERDDGTIYRVTKLGKAVYSAIILIEDALVIKDILYIIDSLDTHPEIPPSERNTIIERLIDNKKIKRILIKKDLWQTYLNTDLIWCGLSTMDVEVALHSPLQFPRIARSMHNWSRSAAYQMESYRS